MANKWKRFSACITTLVVLLAAPSVAQEGDWGYPDTMYFDPMRVVTATCDGKLLLGFPIHIFSDDYSNLINFGFTWSENMSFVRLDRKGQWGVPTALSLTVDTLSRYGLLRLYESNYGFRPAAGTLAEIVMAVDIGELDSVQVTILDFAYWQMNFNTWRPRPIDSIFTSTVPAIIFDPGDVDCSLLVTVSDVVAIISYVFGGLTSINTQEYVDVDHNCMITISDAIYLISYIFDNGPDPQQGCIP